ncbi:MAG: hypothetical protein LQ341_006279 [Variospora aurantia]|nr:MAG: hypothetical protein LQ341_006279 [Variospora aurantia]
MGSMNKEAPTEHGGIPIVDFASWTICSPPEEKQRIASQLAQACQSIGFVYIVNHRIPHERLQEAFHWSKKLFNLEQEQKMLAPHPPGHVVHRGYSWPGLEKVSNSMGDEDDPDLATKLRQVSDLKPPHPHKESYEIGSDDYKDQPNVWLPEHVLPGFRNFMTSFYWHSWENAKMILQAMAIGIGLEDEDYFLRYHSGHENQLRLLHYPSVPAASLEEGSMTRMDAHSDWGSITMLFQDNCGGLQIGDPNKPGQFIDAKPLQDAIVLNIGDLLQRWSNDTLKSSLHRVTLPPRQDRFTGDERLTQERYSIPYFVGPIGTSIIETIPKCIDERHPPKYDPVTWDDYRLMRGSMQYMNSEVAAT